MRTLNFQEFKQVDDREVHSLLVNDEADNYLEGYCKLPKILNIPDTEQNIQYKDFEKFEMIFWYDEKEDENIFFIKEDEEFEEKVEHLSGEEKLNLFFELEDSFQDIVTNELEKVNTNYNIKYDFNVVVEASRISESFYIKVDFTLPDDEYQSFEIRVSAHTNNYPTKEMNYLVAANQKTTEIEDSFKIYISNNIDKQVYIKN